MDNKREKKLLIIWGAMVTFDGDGNYMTKNPIAEYLHQISDSFDSCTWVAPRYMGTDYKGTLDERKVRVVVEERGWVGRIASWFQMVKLAWEHGYVLYYLPNPHLPVFPLIRGRASRLAVYLAGDYEFGIQWHASQRWPGWSTLFRWSFEFPMRYADAVIARGKRLARIGARFNANVFETVPLGHMNFATLGNHSSSRCTERTVERHVLYVGKIVEAKGVRDLLDAFELLVRRNPEQRFLLDLLGEGSDRAEYQALLRKRGLEQHVTFHGWISSEEQIDGFFRHADVLVVPSSVYPEGVPRVIDEAIVRGVPVVATPVGGIGEEFCDDEVMLVNERDPAGLSTAIERMLFDAGTRAHHLKQAARRRELFRRHGSAARQHVGILLDTI